MEDPLLGLPWDLLLLRERASAAGAAAGHSWRLGCGAFGRSTSSIPVLRLPWAHNLLVSGPRTFSRALNENGFHRQVFTCSVTFYWYTS